MSHIYFLHTGAGSSSSFPSVSSGSGVFVAAGALLGLVNASVLNGDGIFGAKGMFPALVKYDVSAGCTTLASVNEGAAGDGVIVRGAAAAGAAVLVLALLLSSSRYLRYCCVVMKV